MPQLIHEIILPANRASWRDKLKAATGLGGVAARMRSMGVDAITAELMEHQVKIDEVTGFAHALWERHILDSEMPIEVINVSRVNRLIGEVLNGGFWQFVHNTGWNKDIVDGTRDGLKTIGADEHLAVFEGAARMIDHGYANGGNIDLAKFEAELKRLENEWLSDANLSRRLSRSVNADWTWGNRWDAAQILSSRYIDSWRKVRRVPPERYAVELDKLVTAIPDLDARLKARDDARPWEKKMIEREMTARGFDNIWYTTFSSRPHNGKLVWCWNFTTGFTPGEGHHQAIFCNGEAIVFKGNSDEIVVQVPCPEIDEGRVARNEPAREPAAGHSNLTYKIGNP